MKNEIQNDKLHERNNNIIIFSFLLSKFPIYSLLYIVVMYTGEGDVHLNGVLNLTHLEDKIKYFIYTFVHTYM